MRLISLKTTLTITSVLLIGGCGFLSSGPSSDSYSLSYRVHLGLDCGMIFDCGYRIELDEDGVLEFFNEPDDAESIAQVQITADEIQEVKDILNQYDFFTSEYDWTNDEGSLSHGSALIDYQASDSNEGRFKTIPFEGEGIPESLMTLRSEIDNYLRSKIGIG